MHFRFITQIIAILTFFIGISMSAPLIVSLIYNDGSTQALLFSTSITASVGLFFFVATRRKETVQLNHRDGIAVVTFGWLMAGGFGALPYILSGVIPGFTDAYFEAVSGFTTTGATVLSDIERVPQAILLWRSQTQWMGGMGIIVLSIAILPFLGVGGMQLYKAEIPSPVVDKLKPRISETAKTLWKVYLIITVLEVMLLLGGGMSVFDAVCHAFCTMPTGGFSTKNASIAYFGSPYFDVIFILFMLLAGINFSLHYRLIRGDFKVFGTDPECRAFLFTVALFVLVITLNIHGSVYGSIFQALRYASFQVTSIITTTGFANADYEKWPVLSRFVLLICMFLGAMAGSTGGGMKTMRVMLLIRQGYQEIFRLVHPHAVTTLKLGGKPVPSEVLSSIWGFFVLYILLFALGTLIMAFLGFDMISALGAVAASIGNIGPGLGTVGPAETYLAVPAFGKWVLTLCMLLGRLEIYTPVVLLTPEYWRK